MTTKEWNKLLKRIETHNKQIGGEIELEDFKSLVVIDIPTPGIVICANKKGLQQILAGSFNEYEIGDTLGLEPNGETHGEAVGMNIIKKPI